MAEPVLPPPLPAVAAAARVSADAARDAEKRLELIAELARLALLACLAVAFANFGQMELASAALGGALALLKPRGAPGPNLSALTLGLAVGAGAFFVQSSGLV